VHFYTPTKEGAGRQTYTQVYIYQYLTYIPTYIGGFFVLLGYVFAALKKGGWSKNSKHHLYKM